MLAPIAALAVVALVSALQLYGARRAAHEGGSIGAALLMGTATWVGWALLIPPIIWLNRHFDFRRGRRGLSALVHLAAALCCDVPITWLVATTGYLLYANPTEHFPNARVIWLSMLTSSRLPLTLLIYAALLLLDRTLLAWRRLEEREMQANRLEAQAARARLEVLATRLQPHFLFNTLHAIGALTDENPRLARRVLVQLGDLLRDVLAEPGAIEISLRDEFALLQRYLDIEQTRFADRLRIEIDASPDALDVAVPRLLLQPLVENALRHGLAPRAAGGLLRIRAMTLDGKLVLQIWNDGVPIGAHQVDGIGLATTRERLHTRYGAVGRLLLRAAAEGGVETIVELPLVAVPT